uniref:Uncharacterized protein n=1 Tax=Sphaerodactylus townsendi TaxID=933632 RepID=A0ACB8E5U6_9SAUR
MAWASAVLASTGLADRGVRVLVPKPRSQMWRQPAVEWDQCTSHDNQTGYPHPHSVIMMPSATLGDDLQWDGSIENITGETTPGVVGSGYHIQTVTRKDVGALASRLMSQKKKPGGSIATPLEPIGLYSHGFQSQARRLVS